MSTAIDFDHVSKQYRLGLVSTKTLSHDIRRFWITNILGKEDPYLKIGETNDRASKGNSEYVWALRDIDFKVEQGDVVGIIGKNGAGKSTLLKLLSRVTGPTIGTIRAHGRIGSLLEVGTGFHNEMTGRENIFMNGAILGMSRAEIQSKLDEIIDFSGCERYIDTPVKRYSSGMTVRLGFAVAAFLEPEILVVDEVLAVGDAEFQKKAIGKMKDVSQGQGRTVLFVSHNMASIRQLCNHGVVLKNGMIDYIGSANECVDRYIASNYEMSQTHVWTNKNEDANKAIRLMSAELTDAEGVSKGIFSCDEDIMFNLIYNVRKKIPGLYGYLEVTKIPAYIKAIVSDSNDVRINYLEDLPLGESKVSVVIPKRTLAPGEYLIGANLNSQVAMQGNYLDESLDICRFEVHDYTTNRGDRRDGFTSKILDWKF